MKRRFRLRSSTDFERVRRSGKSYTHPLVVLVGAPNGLDQVRVGVAAGRSVGAAVARNRAKRVLRACLQGHMDCLRPGWDVIVIARKGLPEADFQAVKQAVAHLLTRANLLVKSNGTISSRLPE